VSPFGKDGMVVRDKDGFLRDERGLLSMPHLSAAFGIAVGVWLIALSSWGFLTATEGWIMILNIGGGLIGASVGLEGYQSTIESRNMRSPQ
jgi:hypothetical protein